ncbi:MAG: ATP-binding cassette domain-containing protein [Vicinamibacterales bacterium]
MSHALIEIASVVKDHAGVQPLRINTLRVDRGDRYTLAGFDAGAAETLIHLITGAALPDEGDVRIAGASTRDIATDTAWLASLDRFGLVTSRAVLLGHLTLADNLALPLTLSIDPIPDHMRPEVERLADDVGLARDRLTAAVEALSPVERVRLNLARAVASNPALLLLEHPTATLDAGSAAAVGTTLRRLADARGLGWIALSGDDHFARAARGRRLTLQPGTGDLQESSLLRRLFG